MPRSSIRRPLAAALTALALGVTPLALTGSADAVTPAAKPGAGNPGQGHGKGHGATKPGKGTKPSKPGKPGKTPPGQRPILLDLLAINDFHGQLEAIDPTKSSSGRINSTPAGGAAYLATHLDQLRDAAQARGAHTVTVAAGDLIGATPLLSAAFHDEPTIEAMNAIGLDIVSVGNHEFDEGYQELLRMQNGGCLDDGDGRDNQNSCPDGEFEGADFQYLAANVKYEGTDETVFPGYVVKKYDRAKVAFVGMTLEDTPNIVTKAGVEGLEFTDEVETVNQLVPELRAQGVRSIVVLLHQGGTPADPTQYNGCAGVTGPGVDIAEQLDPAIDVVVTGHTHQAYNCTVQDPAGNPRLLTSASSVGRIVTDISLQIDPRTKDVVRPTATAENHIVTNQDGTEPRGDLLALIARYTELVAPIANQVLGALDGTASLSRTADADGGDSPLGNLIADSMVADDSTVTGGQEPVVALMNPGGIRADLVENEAGDITYGAAFTVQPFNNYLVSMTVTGEELRAVLNEQWNGRNATSYKVLQVAGLRYTWDTSEAAGTGDAVVGDVLIDADGDPATAMVPVDPAASYRIVVNSFLADGGDGFPTLGSGAEKYFGGLDIDALADYLAANAPYTPTATDRITTVP